MMDAESVFLLYESQVSILAKQVQDYQYTKLSLILVITFGSRDTRMKNTLVSIFFSNFFFFYKGKGLLIFNLW